MMCLLILTVISIVPFTDGPAVHLNPDRDDGNQPNITGNKAAYCNEELPPCDVISHTVNASHCYLNGTKIPTCVVISHVITDVSKSCTMDPLMDSNDILDTLIVPTDVYFQIHCSKKSNHITFNFARDILYTKALGHLNISDCMVYWKDISAFGQAVNTTELVLLNVHDEFRNHVPEYYESCVKKESHSLENSTRSSAHYDHLVSPIKGLASVEYLMVTNPGSSILSSVFTGHLWPKLREVFFQGYSIGQEMGKALSVSMPVLQSLHVYAGRMSTDEGLPSFPWCKYTLPAPRSKRIPDSLRLRYCNSNIDKYVNTWTDGFQPEGVTVHRRMLTLDGFQLSDVHNIRFSGLLHKIKLTNSGITSISNQMFRFMKGLQELDMSYNDISSLPADVFLGLTDIITLNIEHNIIRHLPGGLFYGLSNLVYVLFKCNQLQELNMVDLQNLPRLRKIDFSNNSIISVSTSKTDSGFGDLIRVFALSIGSEIVGLDYRYHLDASPSNISFSHIHELIELNQINGVYHPNIPKELNLQSNPVTHMDQDVFMYFGLLLSLDFLQVDVFDNFMFTGYDLNTLYKYLNDPTGSYTGLRKVDGIFPYNFNTIARQTPDEIRLPDYYAQMDCMGVGNGCPEHCTCLMHLEGSEISTVVHCEGQQLDVIPTNVPNYTYRLLFGNNNLTGLTEPLPKYMDELQELDLSNNLITDLDTSLNHLALRLEILKLHGNRLLTLPKSVNDMGWRVRLTLRGNNFHCDCNSLWLKAWMINRTERLLDVDQIICETGGPAGEVLIKAADDKFVCLSDHMFLIASVAGAAASVLLLIILLAIPAYKYRGEIKIYIYMHFHWHPFDRAVDTDVIGKDYDAFVSYSHHDAHWVCQDLRLRLEPRFRLCLHDRDFMVGAAVAENITSAVDTSRRMILVLSKAYLRSHWCYLEFRQAHYKVLKERSNYLIVVLCEDVSSEDLDNDLRIYLKTNTYLSRDNSWFWDKLIYAMPQRPLIELQDEITPGKTGDQNQDSNNNSSHAEPQPPSLNNHHHCQYRDPNNEFA